MDSGEVRRFEFSPRSLISVLVAVWNAEITSWSLMPHLRMSLYTLSSSSTSIPNPSSLPKTTFMSSGEAKIDSTRPISRFPDPDSPAPKPSSAPIRLALMLEWENPRLLLFCKKAEVYPPATASLTCPSSY